RQRFVLRNPRRTILDDLMDRLLDRIETEREYLLVVERSSRIVGTDRDLFLQKNRPGVDARVRPEYRQPAPHLAADDLPIARAAPAIAWQQRRVKADRSEARESDDALGHNHGDEGEHDEVCLMSCEFSLNVVALHRLRLIHRNRERERLLLQRIDLAP